MKGSCGNRADLNVTTKENEMNEAIGGILTTLSMDQSMRDHPDFQAVSDGKHTTQLKKTPATGMGHGVLLDQWNLTPEDLCHPISLKFISPIVRASKNSYYEFLPREAPTEEFKVNMRSREIVKPMRQIVRIRHTLITEVEYKLKEMGIET